jgi:hypothetical protein
MTVAVFGLQRIATDNSIFQTFVTGTGHASTAAVRGKSPQKNVRNSSWVKLIEAFLNSLLSAISSSFCST